MYEQMEESTDRCWAFNKAGQRCEMVAGHDRDHNVIIAWGPDECWTPGDSFDVALREYGNPRAMGIADGHLPQPVEAAAGSGRCAICEHPHHPDGVCGADDGGFDCDCANSFEA